MLGVEMALEANESVADSRGAAKMLYRIARLPVFKVEQAGQLLVICWRASWTEFGAPCRRRA